MNNEEIEAINECLYSHFPCQLFEKKLLDDMNIDEVVEKYRPFFPIKKPGQKTWTFEECIYHTFCDILMYSDRIDIAKKLDEKFSIDKIAAKQMLEKRRTAIEMTDGIDLKRVTLALEQMF